MSKLKDAGPTAAVRIKVCGTKDEIVTTMINPFHAQQGSGFNLGKALKKTGKTIAKGAKAAAPYVSAASDAAILAGTVTEQPEVRANFVILEVRDFACFVAWSMPHRFKSCMAFLFWVSMELYIPKTTKKWRHF